MKRVTGIGGLFFKSADPKSLGAWYCDHLGLNVADWGCAIFQLLQRFTGSRTRTANFQTQFLCERTG